MRELTQHELDRVIGGWAVEVGGNPGNFKDVGKAGEKTPSFMFGGSFIPDTNGNHGNSQPGTLPV
jgi:hypothetical protein